MIVIGEAPRGRGCAWACAPRSSTAPAAASAAPASSTVRRSISPSSAVDWLAISPPWRFGTRALQVNEDCRLPLAPVKGTGPGVLRQSFSLNYRKDLDQQPRDQGLLFRIADVRHDLSGVFAAQQERSQRRRSHRHGPAFDGSVPIKSLAQQAVAMLFSVRELLVRQRGHAAELGVGAPLGEKGWRELAGRDCHGRRGGGAKQAIALLGREVERIGIPRYASGGGSEWGRDGTPIAARWAAPAPYRRARPVGRGSMRA